MSHRLPFFRDLSGAYRSRSQSIRRTVPATDTAMPAGGEKFPRPAVIPNISIIVPAGEMVQRNQIGKTSVPLAQAVCLGMAGTVHISFGIFAIRRFQFGNNPSCCRSSSRTWEAPAGGIEIQIYRRPRCLQYIAPYIAWQYPYGRSFTFPQPLIWRIHPPGILFCAGCGDTCPDSNAAV